MSSNSSVVSQFDYTTNALGQRTALIQTGTAFTSSNTLDWSYNVRGEITAANHSDNTQDRAFAYDGIGNRQKSANSLTLPAANNYNTNSLNQYTSLPGSTGVSPVYDADGNLTNGTLPTDQAGNASLIWDAENRLVAVTKSDNTITRFSYDYQSRRISRSADVPSATTYYIYDGWNPIAEYTGNTLKKSYTWGMDLSGSMQGAGGVGGLLSVTDHGSPSTDHFFPTYDGNGNISEYLDSTGTTQAHYEYDTFGNLTVSTGAKANDFDHKFSTKPQDTETGLYYYGYRYYDPVTGRWPSRDPIEEAGGMNLYGMALNTVVNLVDILGLSGYIDSGPFYRHWLWGDGSDMHVKFSDYDPKWSAITFEDYISAQKDICDLGIGDTIDVDEAKRYDTNAGPGNVDVRLSGTYTKYMDGTKCMWKFKGAISIDDNLYDFDKKKWGQRDGGDSI